jgi:hypothetical protein
MKMFHCPHIEDHIEDMQSGHGTKVNNVQLPATYPSDTFHGSKNQEASIRQINKNMRDPSYQW